MIRWTFVLVLAAGLLASCGGGEAVPSSSPDPRGSAGAGDRGTPSGEPIGDGSSPVRLVRIAEGLTEPTTIAYPNDGSARLFIAERAGVVRVFDGVDLLKEPFLDIGEKVVLDFPERGLIGLVFHPEYATNGRFYVAYTRVGVEYGEGGDIVVDEYRVSEGNPNIAIPVPTRRIIVVHHFDIQGHNGGQLAFGPDGYLYIGIGDAELAGALFRRAEDLNILTGKLLRIRVPDSGDYVVPDDNPFVGRDGHDEIWAYGLRNPWRFSFDRETGDLYIGDVGEAAMEEVNFQPSSSRGGENYGWPTMEGTECVYPKEIPCGDPSLTAPIVAYGREGTCAVIGGYVYRGPSAVMDGIYLYTDYCGGIIWGARHCEGEGWATAVILDARDAFESHGFTTFGEGKDARIFMAVHEGWLYELEPRPDGQLPAELRC
jgi:glucose/arabinose dehydrogenase